MLKKLSSILGTIACCGTATAAPLEIGSNAPALSATNQDGQTIDLSAEMAQGLTLIYFFPKASTPG